MHWDRWSVQSPFGILQIAKKYVKPLGPFKFNHAWILEKDFSSIVNSSWASHFLLPIEDHIYILNFKLKRLKGVVK